MGGRLSCLSVLRAQDLWCATDRRLHVRVPSGAQNLASPHDRRIPLGRPERFGVVVHRSQRAPYLDEPEGPVDSFACALLHSIVCQSKYDAIVTLDSALKKGRITRTELEFLVAGLPAKYRAYLELTDPNAASGLETKARLGLRVERDGEQVGTVKLVEHMPAQDLLIVKTNEGTEVMVPFVKAIVPSVDLAAGVVTVTPPTGLFEELPDDDEPAPPASDAE